MNRKQTKGGLDFKAWSQVSSPFLFLLLFYFSSFILSYFISCSLNIVLPLAFSLPCLYYRFINTFICTIARLHLLIYIMSFLFEFVCIIKHRHLHCSMFVRGPWDIATNSCCFKFIFLYLSMHVPLLLIYTVFASESSLTLVPLDCIFIHVSLFVYCCT